MLIPLIVMIVLAKEPPEIEHQSFVDHIRCLWQADGWMFNFIYIITFGGFIGLSTFLPTFFYDQFAVTKVQAGQLTVLATLMGSAIRILGGYVADRIGGIVTLAVVLLCVIAVSLVLTSAPSLVLTTILFMACFAALGAGNGALFQLVPLRFPATTAVAGSMIGEIGALGGAFVPNAMGLSKQYSGSFAYGFIAFAVLTVVVLGAMMVMQRGWVGVWVGRGGKPLLGSDPGHGYTEPGSPATAGAR
jgi:NNP family nitrate/nitrite transporter-like MFS transporter